VTFLNIFPLVEARSLFTGGPVFPSCPWNSDRSRPVFPVCSSFGLYYLSPLLRNIGCQFNSRNPQPPKYVAQHSLAFWNSFFFMNRGILNVEIPSHFDLPSLMIRSLFFSFSERMKMYVPHCSHVPLFFQPIRAYHPCCFFFLQSLSTFVDPWFRA